MKTNQMMVANFAGCSLHVEHLTKMGSLTELWAIGNSYREKRGLQALDLSNYMRSPELLEFVKALESDPSFEINHLESDLQLIDNIEHSSPVISTGPELTPSKPQHPGTVATIKSQFIVSRRGRNAGTWAHLFILLDAASRLDARFKLQVYKELVSGGLLAWRDSSGDAFKELNQALDKALPEGKSVSRYTSLANIIRVLVIGVEGEWNAATAAQLKARDKLENHVIAVLRSGLVTRFDQLHNIVFSLGTQL